MPKKYVFCIFHVLQLAPGNRRTDALDIGTKVVIMASSLTVRKSAQFLFPGKTGYGKSGKNPDMKFPKFVVRY